MRKVSYYHYFNLQIYLVRKKWFELINVLYLTLVFPPKEQLQSIHVCIYNSHHNSNILGSCRCTDCMPYFAIVKIPNLSFKDLMQSYMNILGNSHP